MNNPYPNVLSPIRVAGHLLKNRVISGPSTIHTASNGEDHPTEAGIRFFEDRARAGVGLVTCAGVSIGGFNNDGVHASWDITIPNRKNALCDLAERIHVYGAKCTMELIGVMPDGWTVSPGCTIMGWAPGRDEQVPVEVMEQFKAGYVEAAKAIKECGFDGILFHMGHSIPIAQFLSPLTNKRTDEYGGSTENRCRYPREILKACREAVGRDMIFDVRISGSEYMEGGIDLEEGIRIGEQLKEYADILQISAGMHNPDRMTVTHPCSFLPPMPNVWLAEGFKKSGKFDDIVISTVGGVDSLSAADDIISSGKADMVVIARALIADIDLLKKDRAGCHGDVIPCIKCMRCHDSDNYAQHMQCSVNPMVGLETPLEKVLAQPVQPKKVAVIGGGPAGMEAALTALSRGHQVTLFEKSGSLGGALKFSDYVSFKYALKDYKDYLIRQVEKSKIDVRLNTKASPDDVKDFDAVIAAIGADPLVPPIPGVENALVATSTYGHEDTLGSTVIVIGGGQVGCETALHLAKLGKKAIVVEMQTALAPDASKTHRDELMLELDKEKNFEAVLSARCTGVTATSVTFDRDGKHETVTADSVVLAAGMRAKVGEADSFMGLNDFYREVGDCVRARTVEWATKEGFYAAITV